MALKTGQCIAELFAPKALVQLNEISWRRFKHCKIQPRDVYRGAYCILSQKKRAAKHVTRAGHEVPMKAQYN